MSGPNDITTKNNRKPDTWIERLTRRDFITLASAAGLVAAGGLTAGPLFGCSSRETAEIPPQKDIAELISRVSPPLGYRPNVVVILCDDLGYGDIGCYGGRAIRTPAIDRLAREGVRFTDFYACNALCSPSRVGLLTGRYPLRSGVTWPLWPLSETFRRKFVRRLGNGIFGKLGVADMGPESSAEGLGPEEITLPEALKVAGYRTGMVGKWHLGDFSVKPEYNPVRHGFDFFYGLPHSNDMFPCALYRNDEELEADIGTNQARLTGLYTKEAVDFIEEAKDGPFFLYFAHTFPHQPLYASEEFLHKSAGGLYGDTVEEIDASVAEVLKCLERNGLADNTLVIVTSDNGPWFEGSPGGLRGRKGQSYEGGFRVPLIARLPGVIPAGSVSEAAAMNIDLFPTCLALAGLSGPADRVVDGADITELLTGREKEPSHEAFFFYHHDGLEGVRSGKWKYFRNINHYVYPLPVDKEDTPIGRMGRGRLGRWPLLYDMDNDPDESYNLIDTYPEVGQQMLSVMEAWEKETADNPRGWIR
jgi:arylsulfatase A